MLALSWRHLCSVRSRLTRDYVGWGGGGVGNLLAGVLMEDGRRCFDTTVLVFHWLSRLALKESDPLESLVGSVNWGRWSKGEELEGWRRGSWGLLWWWWFWRLRVGEGRRLTALLSQFTDRCAWLAFAGTLCRHLNSVDVSTRASKQNLVWWVLSAGCE